MEEKKRIAIVGAYMVVLIVAGLLWPNEGSFWEAYHRILVTPGVLISDFFAVGTIGTALVNAGVVGLLGLLLTVLSRTSVSGPTIAGVFTLAGFALFGKTPINIWPVIFGVACGAWLRRERFSSLIVVALFGTALGPVVSQIAFGFGQGYVVGAAVGIAVGIILPAMASHVLHNHQGFNLYNVGFTCGIVGMYVTAHLKMVGLGPDLEMVWGDESQLALAVFFTLFFLTMVILGWPGRGELPKLWRLSGTLVTDFVSMHGFSASLMNMGLVGLIGMAYIGLVNGTFNGPTLGGVFTMVGFAAFGKHVRNVWPLMAGVFIAAYLSTYGPGNPGPLLAALFGTTLAPIAGGFGPFVGLLAGAVHLAVVMHVGIFHAGLNLYNNGFAGGLVGTLFIAVSRWFNLGRPE